MGVPGSTSGPGYVPSPDAAATPKEPAAATPKQPASRSDPALAIFNNVIHAQSQKIAEATVDSLRAMKDAGNADAQQTIELGEAQRKEAMSIALQQAVKAAVDTKLQAVVKELVDDFNKNFDANQFDKIMLDDAINQRKQYEEMADKMAQWLIEESDKQMKNWNWSA